MQDAKKATHQEAKMSLLDIFGVDDLCKLVESYASEFKGLLCKVMPAIVGSKLPQSIAALDGKIALTVELQSLDVVDLKTATRRRQKFGANLRMVSVTDQRLAIFHMRNVSLLDMQAEECVWSKKVPTHYDVCDLKLLPNDSLAILDGVGFLIWDLRQGNQTLDVGVAHLHDVAGLDAQTTVAAVGDFLHVYTHGQLACKQRAHNVMQLFDLPGRRFAAGSKDHKIMVWDANLTCLYTIDDAKFGCMLSDGSLATTCADGHHIRVYKEGTVAHDIPYFGWPIVALAALPQGRLASFHMHGDVCIWH
jgi:hypothetical protein